MQATPFHFVRDYEVVKVEQEVPNEFIIMIDDGDDELEVKVGEVLKPSRPRVKGAYYKNIERKMVLKKKRINVRVYHRIYTHSPTTDISAVIRSRNEEMAHHPAETHKNVRR